MAVGNAHRLPDKGARLLAQIEVLEKQIAQKSKAENRQNWSGECEIVDEVRGKIDKVSHV